MNGSRICSIFRKALCTDIYDPSSEGGIPWDDPTIHVEWPQLDVPYKTSAKDKLHESFRDQKFEYFEQY